MEKFTYILCLDCGLYAVEATDGAARERMTVQGCEHPDRWSVRDYADGRFVS